jgi:hypothetical protein
VAISKGPDTNRSTSAARDLLKSPASMTTLSTAIPHVRHAEEH